MKIIHLLLTTLLLTNLSCGELEDKENNEEENRENFVDQTSAPIGHRPDTTTNNEVSPGFSGDLKAYFIGHSAMNDVVADHVATNARLADSNISLDINEATTESITLEGKMEVGELDDIFKGEDHSYDFAVITEVWDYQNYNPHQHGVDSNAAPEGCPGEGYDVPPSWDSAPYEYYPTPYFVQRYRDAFVCGNDETKVFYYQTWSLGFNEVTNGDTRVSDSNFQRPSLDKINTDINDGITPDLPLADRIEYEGVKWERLVGSANRPDIIFIPAAYALVNLMRDIESGTAPGFEALGDSGGLLENGKVAWTDYLFYEDQYHLASIGHYFMSFVIYAAVFNTSPEGIEIGSGNYPASEYFEDNQYPLVGISDEEYESLLTDADAKGVYDLRGYQGKDYVPDSLRIYLQKLAWDTVTKERASED